MNDRDPSETPIGRFILMTYLDELSSSPTCCLGEKLWWRPLLARQLACGQRFDLTVGHHKLSSTRGVVDIPRSVDCGPWREYRPCVESIPFRRRYAP